MFLVRTFLRKGKTVRSESQVLKEYKEAWGESANDILFGRKLRVQRVGNRLIINRAIDSRKFFLGHINSIIRSFHPESILELGSGIGINTLALAVFNPDIKKLRGVELTEEGFRQSQTLLKNPPLEALVYLTGESKEVVLERLKGRDIEFIKGSILELPFPDKSFDFVYSLWVLEQIPEKYPQAFKEAHRVLKGHALFIEEFREAQRNVFQRIHLRNVDYFHASYTEVEKAGLRPLRFEPLPMDKIKLTYGSLLVSPK